MRLRMMLLLATVFGTSLTACSKSESQVDNPSTVSKTPPTPETQPQNPSSPTAETNNPAPTTPPNDICQDGRHAIGANVTFLIDNSNSNSVTDCPSPTRLNPSAANTADLWRCGSQTHRELAVLAAYDVLAEVSQKDERDMAVSQVAIVQFPTSENNQTGSRVMTNSWIKSNDTSSGRASIASAMMFARTPSGATPYGSAVDAAYRLYNAMSNDGRGRSVILVTDGEPTDKDPLSVSAQAIKLQALGVDVITVFVTNGQSKAQRSAAHTQMMTNWESQARPRHFYTGNYPSFDRYLDVLIGRNGQASLAQNISSKASPECVDQVNQICERYLLEISAPGSLAKTLNEIIRSKVVRCQ